jgi:hypothetical protein
MILRQQDSHPGLVQHHAQEFSGDIAFLQALAVLGEHRHIPDRRTHRQADKPAEHQIVIHLLHRLPLGADCKRSVATGRAAASPARSKDGHASNRAGRTHEFSGPVEHALIAFRNPARPFLLFPVFKTDSGPMQHHRSPKDDELHTIIEERLTSFFREMEDANWRANEVAFAIQRILKEKWLDRAEALQEASDRMPKDFVSDGNEG